MFNVTVETTLIGISQSSQLIVLSDNSSKPSGSEYRTQLQIKAHNCVTYSQNKSILTLNISFKITNLLNQETKEQQDLSFQIKHLSIRDKLETNVVLFCCYLLFSLSFSIICLLIHFQKCLNKAFIFLILLLLIFPQRSYFHVQSNLNLTYQGCSQKIYLQKLRL